MIPNPLYLILWVVLALTLIFSGPVAAHNKVVVIPLGEKLDPYAPVTAVSPPNSAYFNAGIFSSTVTDKVTGLVWQKETADTDKDGDVDHNDKVIWHAAWIYCINNAVNGLPGTGWRLPSVDEQMSIVNYGTYSPAINSVAFPGTKLSHYWSVLPFGPGDDVWSVDFDNGRDNLYDKSSTGYVRCVRGVPNRQSLFKNNGNGTVTDLATGLTWQREDDNVQRANNGPAATYCQGLPLAGGGWRLPTIKELRSIVDRRVYNPAIDSNAFPGNDSAVYWSATTLAYGSGFAWYVYFELGNVYYSNKSDTNYVRCVR